MMVTATVYTRVACRLLSQEREEERVESLGGVKPAYYPFANNCYPQDEKEVLTPMAE